MNTFELYELPYEILNRAISAFSRKYEPFPDLREDSILIPEEMSDFYYMVPRWALLCEFARQSISRFQVSSKAIEEKIRYLILNPTSEWPKFKEFILRRVESCDAFVEELGKAVYVRNYELFQSTTEHKNYVLSLALEAQDSLEIIGFCPF